MSEAVQQVFEELADRYDRRHEARQRDLFLVLAADAAWSDGRRGDAERLRGRLLQFNPHHLLGPFPSFAEALNSPDMQSYLSDLRRQFPVEEAETLLLALRADGAQDAAEMPIFKMREESAIPRAGPAQPSPAVPPGAAPSVPPPPARTRKGRPASRSPYDIPTLEPEIIDDPDLAGSWLALILFVVVLILALGLAAYALIRPLLL
jgi:hypothetical protein